MKLTDGVLFHNGVKYEIYFIPDGKDSLEYDR